MGCLLKREKKHLLRRVPPGSWGNLMELAGSFVFVVLNFYYFTSFLISFET